MERQFSRRAALIGGGVALGAVGAAGVLAATGQQAAAADAPQVPSPTVARVGATFNLFPFAPGTTYPEAMKTWNATMSSPGVPRPMRCWKVFYQLGQFPTSIDDEIQTIINNDIQALITFKPAITPSSDDLKALAKAVKMFSDAHLKAEMCLWQEVRPATKGPGSGMTAEQYHTYVQYYGPAIRPYYPLVFDAAGSQGPDEWAAYDPGHTYVDGYAIDYYCPTYFNKDTIRLDALATLAGDLPVGIWEIGNADSSPFFPSRSQLNEYMSYLTNFLTNRLAAGRPVGSVAWYNGPADASYSNQNEIVGTNPNPLAPLDITDYRLLYDAVNGKSPA